MNVGQICIGTFLMGFALGQQAPAPPVGAQLTAIHVGVAKALAVIGAMPPGPQRSEMEAGLAAFQVMLRQGKVVVTPTPGRSGTPGQPGYFAGGNAASSFTWFEVTIPNTESSSPGSGRVEATPQVGAGGERIELGGFPTGQASGGSLVGDVDGGEETVDSFVAGAIFIHEGLRCLQSYNRPTLPLKLLPWFDCHIYWLNEIQVYRAQARYLDVCMSLPSNDPHRSFYENRRNSRQRRVDAAWVKFFNCF